MTPIDQLRQRLGDRYTIERELGRGGMGAVYLGRDIRLDRPVALKVLPAEFAVQPTLRDRFIRETRTAAGFSHPNIVPVYSVEEYDDLLAYTMGYVEGESLLERVRRAGPLTVQELVRLMQDVAYALAYAHGRGIVHRDIKPDNIMLERATGRAQVMDFGIARAKSSAPVSNAGLTRVGEVVGTPEYMSPEQASGDEVDGRSDLYSLGLTIYFAVTGKNAVSAETTQKVLVKQLTETLPSIGTLRSDLPEPLANAIDRCVAKDPADRFENAEALVGALDATQLAVPEIPLPIRMFQQEASTLSLLLVGLVFALISIAGSFGESEDPGLQMIVMILAIAIVFTRFMQTMSEARRLAVAGFLPDEIISGLKRVMDERETRREQLRRDTHTVKARRFTVVMAVVQLAISAMLFQYALQYRVETSPGYYSVNAAGTVMVTSSMILLGVGMVLLLKSPLRMPLGERYFRTVWLTAPGRAFVSFAGRKARRQAIQTGTSGSGFSPARTGASGSHGSGAVDRVSGDMPRVTPNVNHASNIVTPDSAPATLPVPFADPISALEARVSALETWRRQTTPDVTEP